jgi:flagellar hook-associated protein 1
MFGLDIALSGLRVAQQSLGTVGTNMANVTTDGYHRQTAQIAPVDTGGAMGLSMGGAEVTSVVRAIDGLLESEILRQRPLQGQLQQELPALESVEDALGTLDSEGLWKSLEGFFSSLDELAGQSDSLPLKEQAVRAADMLAGEFRRMGAFLGDLDSQIEQEAQRSVNRVNALASQIADMDGQIQARSATGGNVNILMDQRDQAIAELSDLADVQVSGADQPQAQTNVSVWGVPVVAGATTTQLACGWLEGGQLGVGPAGGNYLQTSVSGGGIAGLLSLKNDLLAGIRDNLDALAKSLATSVNSLHVQGVGAAGSFTELLGDPVPPGALGTWGAGITAGTFYVRALNDVTGVVARFAINVNPATDTIADIASRLDAIGGISASVVGGALHIQADPGRRFDFLPAVLENPYSSTLTGTAVPSFSGLYTGSQNQMYTCRLAAGGQVGATAGLTVEVWNGAGEMVRALDIGAGYAAGEALELENGVYVSFSPGTVNVNAQVTTRAIAQSDPTGVLAAAGINTFFSGGTLDTLTVRQDVLADPRRLATAVGRDGLDNLNIRRMADLGSAPSDLLNGQTPREACQEVMTNLGQTVEIRKARQTAADSLLQQLENQRDQASGVDMNEEAARMLSFEQMFAGMSKYVSVLDKAMQSLLEVI